MLTVTIASMTGGSSADSDGSSSSSSTTTSAGENKVRQTTTPSTSNGRPPLAPSNGDGGRAAARERKPAVFMSVPRLICVNAVVCGLELCANAGFAYIPPMLLKAGFSETVMSYVLGIAPVLALFTVPAIGVWSDKSRCPWGRRRPFILLLNLVMLCSLILIPLGHFRAGDQRRHQLQTTAADGDPLLLRRAVDDYAGAAVVGGADVASGGGAAASPTRRQQSLLGGTSVPAGAASGNDSALGLALSSALSGEAESAVHWTQSRTLKTIVLAVGVVLLDYASQACFNPCEALLTDVVKGDNAKAERGFIIYSAMLSLGASLGTLTMAVNWTGYAEAIGTDVSTLIFGLLFIISTACLVVTLVAATERPPPSRPSSPALISCSYKELMSTEKGGDKVYNGLLQRGPAGEPSSAMLEEIISIADCHHIGNSGGGKTKQSAFNRSHPTTYGGAGGGGGSSRQHHHQPPPQGSGRARAVFVLACAVPRRAERILKGILRWTAAVGSLAVNAGVLLCPGGGSCGRRQQQQQLRGRFGQHRQPQGLTEHEHRHFHLGIFGFVWCLVVGLLRLMLKIFKWPLEFVRTYLDSPEALKRLFLADLASWTCLMGHGMFYTDFVAQAVYGGHPEAAIGTDAAFDEGARAGSWGLCFFSVVGFLYPTFVQEWVVRKVGLKWNYYGCLAVLCACMIGHVIFKSIYVLNSLSALAGLGFAAVTSVPNTLITVYHSNLELYDPKAAVKKKDDGAPSAAPRRPSPTPNDGELESLYLERTTDDPAATAAGTSDVGSDEDDDDDDDDDGDEDERGVATDISLLDAAYFLSQIILSLTMGYLVDLTGTTTTYMAASAVAGLLSVWLATRVPFSQAQLKSLLSVGGQK